MAQPTMSKGKDQNCPNFVSENVFIFSNYGGGTLHFQVHFQRVFVEFVALLTKIWPKNIDFHHYR